jgi:uncharacterized Ntn-hydrolase superfamily protein
MGRAAAFTGTDRHDWAGSLAGEHYAVQGNILAGRRVVEGYGRRLRSRRR